MKKKYRIKTWDELVNTDGANKVGEHIDHSSGYMFTKKMSKVCGVEFVNDFTLQNGLTCGVSIHKWMCEELPQFNEGDLVLVKRSSQHVFYSIPEIYLMTKKDGGHVCEHNEELSVWDEIKPYTKPTTALEDLIEFKKISHIDNHTKLDAIIKKLS